MRRCDRCNLNWITSIVNKQNPICPRCLSEMKEESKRAADSLKKEANETLSND